MDNKLLFKKKKKKKKSQRLRVCLGTGNICEILAKRISGQYIAMFQNLSCLEIDSISYRLYLGPDNICQIEILL